MSDVRSIEPPAIFAEIDAQPPLMRQRAAAIYLGKEVCWSLKFRNATEFSPGQAHLMFGFGNEIVRMVTGEISLATHPGLVTARVGENLLVRGHLRRIDNMTIELDISDIVLSSNLEAA